MLLVAVGPKLEGFYFSLFPLFIFDRRQEVRFFLNAPLYWYLSQAWYRLSSNTCFSLTETFLVHVRGSLHIHTVHTVSHVVIRNTTREFLRLWTLTSKTDIAKPKREGSLNHWLLFRRLPVQHKPHYVMHWGHSQRSNTFCPILTCIHMCEMVLLLLSGKSESVAAASVANGMSSHSSFWLHALQLSLPHSS